MTNYFKTWTEILQTLKGISDQITFTGGSLNVDTEGGLPSDIYGDAFVLTGGTDTLPDQAIMKGVVIKADDENTNPVLVNGFLLAQGESVPVETDNLQNVVLVGTLNDIVYYLGS